ILKEQLNIFTNKEVSKITYDENNIFYTSCKRIFLIFELLKHVINLLKSCIASLTYCFIEIVQIAAALKRIPTKNIVQIYSFYDLNAKKELKFYDNNFVEMELLNSILNEIIFAEINSFDLKYESRENEIRLYLLASGCS
ncbi:6599_t:CDS:2, partial [Scutellospora calospora]